VIDLNARATSDSQAILNGTLGAGSFARDITFTDPANPGTPQTIKGWAFDTALLGINPETGFPVRGSKLAVSFFQSDLTIWDGKADIQRWTVEFTNDAGQAIVAGVSDVIPDRSFGDVLLMLKIKQGHL
jgi:hypothetical protein